MVLLYLYIKECGILKQAEFNLSDKYTFHFDPITAEICFNENTKSLPSDFFSYDKKNNVVDCVSALIGNNGSGKTTVAEIFANLTSNINFTEHIIILSGRLNGQDRFYYHCNLKCLSDSQSKQLQKTLTGFVPFIPDQYNPKLDTIAFIYATNNYVPYSRISYMDNTINLSTSYLMKNDFEKRMNPSTGEKRNESDSKYHDQMELIRMVEMFSEYASQQVKENTIEASTQKFRLPDPRGLVVKLYSYSLLIEQPLNEISKSAVWRKAVKQFITGITAFRASTNKPEHYILLSFILNHMRHSLLESNPPLRSKAIETFVYDISRCSEKNACQTQLDCINFASALFEYLKKVNEPVLSNNVTVVPDKEVVHFIDFYDKLPQLDLQSLYFSVIQHPTISFSLLDDKSVQSCIRFLQLYFKTVSIVHYLDFEFVPSLSAGEMSQFALYSRIFQRLKDISEFSHQYHTKDIILFFDEIEITIHPEQQRKLVSNVILFLEKYFQLSKYDYHFHVVFSSHSPILLSDIPISNVEFLNRDGNKSKPVEKERMEVENTFGANIHDLYRFPFFMEGGLLGEFAKNQIKSLISWLNGDSVQDGSATKLFTRESALNLIQCIGEPLLRKKLEEMFAFKFNNVLKTDELEKMISAREKEIEMLRRQIKQEGIKE